MKYFKSQREKQLWFWVFVLLVSVYSSIGLAPSFINFLQKEGLLSGAFGLGFLIFIFMIFFHGIQSKPNLSKVMIWLGIIAIYILVMVRISLPEERSHLIEYGVVSIFIHRAIQERVKSGGNISHPTLVTIFIASIFGIVDEVIQFFIPSRVFDFRDIVFNVLAVLMAIGGSSMIRLMSKNKINTK